MNGLRKENRVSKMSKLNGYSLTRNWFNTIYDIEDVRPIHTALYLYIVDLNNRLGWKKVFGVPTESTMEVLKIKSAKTYSKSLKDLERFGFIKFIEISKNQFTSNRIELVKNTEALSEAPSKALSNSVYNSESPYINNETEKPKTIKPSSVDYKKIYEHYLSKSNLIKHKKFTKQMKTAIDKAISRISITEDEIITIIDRHSLLVEATKNEGQYRIRKRPIGELFGQKIANGTDLICSEYLDDGAKWLRYNENPKREVWINNNGIKRFINPETEFIGKDNQLYQRENI
ncbi:MAG: hypothetical protein U9N34_02960 [Candidatus Cloacimonadota bacterium]|nr:hypothetical protein [Candidatus Cloacimonadota bacterium]